jgi:hypothetical protein
MERSTTSQVRGDQEHSTGELVKMMTEHVSVLIRDELKLAQLEMAGKGKQAALGAGMFGASGIVAVYGVGCLLACVIATLLGRQRIRRAAPPVPEQAVADVKADVEEVRERAHR